MDLCIEKLKAFLKEQSAGFPFTDCQSLLEMLFYYYSDEHPIDNAVIHCAFQQVDTILHRLSLRENDELFRVIMSLCSAYEKEAFLSGIRVGAKLIMETSDN